MFSKTLHLYHHIQIPGRIFPGIISVLTAIVILMGSCRESLIDSEKATPVNEIGIFHQKCLMDTSQSYCFVLPAGFDGAKSWPLVMVFDPHGDGDLAIKSMMGAATGYGFMVAGSNVIRNGYEQGEKAFRIMMEDILNRFPVAKERIYVAGLSGGGRFAQVFSQMNMNIRGVVSVGAGFSLNPSQPLRNNIPMLFMAGDRDFNYREILNSGESLSHMGMHYYIYEFGGMHEWPGRPIMDEAVKWMVMEDYRRNKNVRDDDIVRSLKRSVLENASSRMTQNDMTGACREFEKGIAFLSGLTNTRKMEKGMKECMNSDAYRKSQEKIKQSLSLESRLQTGYIQALREKDATWWRNEIGKLNQVISEENDPYYLAAYQRIRSFISMAAYSYCNSALKENDLAGAAGLTDIYRIVDPGNPDSYYFKAVYFSRSGNSELAASFFRTAIDSGFSDDQKAMDELPEKVIKSVLEKD